MVHFVAFNMRTTVVEDAWNAPPTSTPPQLLQHTRINHTTKHPSTTLQKRPNAHYFAQKL
jgi:hypothetical protein